MDKKDQVIILYFFGLVYFGPHARDHNRLANTSVIHSMN